MAKKELIGFEFEYNLGAYFKGGIADLKIISICEDSLYVTEVLNKEDYIGHLSLDDAPFKFSFDIIDFIYKKGTELATKNDINKLKQWLKKKL